MTYDEISKRATPRPWNSLPPNGTSGRTVRDDWDFGLYCVNHYDALLESHKRLVEALEYINRRLSPHPETTADDLTRDAMYACDRARAALEAARKVET